jgi:sulfatase maturation enzyme AslB (radical SAM superfamily)
MRDDQNLKTQTLFTCIYCYLEQEQRREDHEVHMQAQRQEQVRREHEAHIRFHHEQEVRLEQQLPSLPLWPRLPFVMLPKA